jgi:hypothetical protein
MDNNDRRQMSSDDNTSHDPLGEVSLKKISYHAQVSLYTMEGKPFFRVSEWSSTMLNLNNICSWTDPNGMVCLVWSYGA